MDAPPEKPNSDEIERPPLPESYSAEPGVMPVPAPPTLAKRVQSLFVVEGRLRAGWRFLLYVALFALLSTLLGRVLTYGFHHLPKKPGQLWAQALSEMVGLVAVLLAALIFGRFERRSFGDYGLPKRGAFGRLFWIGAVWGLIGITALLALIRLTGDFSFGSPALHGLRMIKFAAFWAFMFLLVGFFEEFLFRGYTQFTLTQGIGFWPAAIALSIIFGAVHLGNKGEALLGALAAALIGLFFCLTLRRTGNLWFAVGFHASWDWGETYLYSVPDSGEVFPGHLLNSSFHGSRWITGGSVGPEGSVLIFVVLLMLWVLFDRSYPGVKYSVQPPMKVAA